MAKVVNFMLYVFTTIRKRELNGNLFPRTFWSAFWRSKYRRSIYLCVYWLFEGHYSAHSSHFYKNKEGRMSLGGRAELRSVTFLYTAVHACDFILLNVRRRKEFGSQWIGFQFIRVLGSGWQDLPTVGLNLDLYVNCAGENEFKRLSPSLTCFPSAIVLCVLKTPYIFWKVSYGAEENEY